MFNGCLKKFLGTLQAILCKIKLTDFWGQIDPTYLKKRLKISKLLLSLMLLLQLCVKRKKPEVSIMFLRGDIYILVPALFFLILVILTAPAVHINQNIHISEHRITEHPNNELPNIKLRNIGNSMFSNCIPIGSLRCVMADV